VARPKGLGLGADRSALLQKNGETKGNMTNNDDDDNLVLEKGAYCLIMKGKHKDHYGVVSVRQASGDILLQIFYSGIYY